MGKAWDGGKVAYDVSVWRAILNASKPGAYLVAFGGTRTYHRLTCAIEDAGWEIRDSLAWMYGTGFPKSHSLLKPAWEPIVLARKPGPLLPLGIDACRIAADWSTDPTRRGWQGRKTANGGMFVAGVSADLSQPNDLGRWPANVVLDEEAAAALDEQSGVSVSSDRPRRNAGTDSFARGKHAPHVGRGHSDSGGASRFFYVAKASRRERTHGGTVENRHPTVKPIALMRWLCRLVTPPGGTILDPFCGSGSTLVAAQLEGFDAIGCELDADSVATARARIAAAEAA